MAVGASVVERSNSIATWKEVVWFLMGFDIADRKRNILEILKIILIVLEKIY